MTAKTEGVQTGEFLVSEANGTLSRESATITGGSYPAGQVLGMITSSKKYTAYTSGASNGSQNAAAILYSAVDASSADASGAIVARYAEVSGGSLTGSDATAITKLAEKGIIIR